MELLNEAKSERDPASAGTAVDPSIIIREAVRKILVDADRGITTQVVKVALKNVRPTTRDVADTTLKRLTETGKV